MIKLTINGGSEAGVLLETLEPGTLCRVAEGRQKNNILLRIFGGAVNLSIPTTDCWTSRGVEADREGGDFPSFKVIPLNKGESVTLTAI